MRSAEPAAASVSLVALAALAALAALVAPSRTAGAQALVTSTAVRLRAEPSTDAAIDSVLPAGTPLRLVSDTSRGEFFRVRVAGGPERSGWVSGRYVMARATRLEAVVPGAHLPPPPAPHTDAQMAAFALAYPACGGEQHYRWAAKVSPTSAGANATSATVAAVLHWAPLGFGQDLYSWCAPRADEEREFYRVTGWVRRAKGEPDGDVHVEITGSAQAAVGKCVVVEIPPASAGPEFAQARQDLTTLLGVASLSGTHDFAHPKRVRFTGIAFFDGWHATSGLPKNHGRCNSTPGAAWELHPVYAVDAP